jgi:hypothetical protein
MSRRKSLILSLLLTIPVILFLIHHYTSHSPELYPTGFTANDNVLYMSYAHQYIDGDNFSLFYSNPFDGNPKSPKIYFQPVNFLFAALLKLGADPGLTFSLFGLIMAFLCIYLGVRIIQNLLPNNKYRVLITILFTWGGGLTAFAGIAGNVFTGMPLNAWTDYIYLADPANGWWGLNWGRILFIPLEAYYHFLFLLNVYLILKNKWGAAILAAAFLSVSHPFTGIEYLLIIIGWLLLEKVIFKNKNIPYQYFAAIIAITIFHGWYYLVYLNSFPEHRQIFSQYSARWTYSFRVFIPAYILVFILSVITLYFKRTFQIFLSSSHERLFFCWAIITFLLSKHEWFIRPMQPIHFTRGYIWAGLFLLGIPGLVYLLEYLNKNIVRKTLLVAFIIIFLNDNILWIGNILKSKDTEEWEGHITKDTKDVFNFLNKTTTSNDLLLGNAPLINYMAGLYTPLNAWISHPYNTPKWTERSEVMKEFFQTSTIPAEWANRRLIIVINKRDTTFTMHPMLKKNKLFENTAYTIFTTP